MNLHQFYFEVWQNAHVTKQRIGQSLFNTLSEVRPDLAEQLRGTEKDPFYANSPMDDRYDSAIKIIEAEWFK